MFGLYLLIFLINIIELCLLISTLKILESNEDLLLDIEKNQRRLDKIFGRKK